MYTSLLSVDLVVLSRVGVGASCASRQGYGGGGGGGQIALIYKLGNSMRFVNDDLDASYNTFL